MIRKHPSAMQALLSYSRPLAAGGNASIAAICREIPPSPRSKGSGSGQCLTPEYRPATTPAELFLHSDAALREVVDQIDPADFSAPVPKEWSQLESATLIDILGRHAYYEAWIPAVIDDARPLDGNPYADADLLGDDPIASYEALNDTATAAVRAGGYAETFRFTYGDYPADEGFAQPATYARYRRTRSRSTSASRSTSPPSSSTD